MPWRQLRVVVAAELADPLAEVLTEAGALAVSLEDAGDQPLFEPARDTTPLWTDTAVIALLAAETDLATVYTAVADAFGTDAQAWPWSEHALADQDWARAWLTQFKPLDFGNGLWVCPSWETPPAPHATNVILDPGCAFGTGYHATTAMCLEWLSRTPVAGARVIDYGCGSGILAIAALKRGAASAVGIDIDTEALAISRANAQANGVAAQYEALLAQDFSAQRTGDVVFANILAGPLVALAPLLTSLVAPHGVLVLSGLLTTQIAEVSAAYAAEFTLDITTRGEWAAIVAQRHDRTAHIAK